MGRSIYCSKCKLEKEEAVRNESYCKACKSERMKKAAIKKRLSRGLPPTRPEREAYCEDCKAKKIQGISIEGRCNPCTVITNRIRLHEKRLLEGKEPIPIRDSSFCHVCNIPKVDGRCIHCRQRMAKERKAKKRLESGKRPWGAGRPLTCYKCGNVKENPDASFCKACQSLQDKERWEKIIAPRVNRKVGPALCPCGKNREGYSSYCKECAAKNMREWRLKQVGGVIKPRKSALTPEEKKLRRDVRAITNSALRRGILVAASCDVCGTDLNIEAHHDDYSKPLDIRWLCKTHHTEHHKTNE